MIYSLGPERWQKRYISTSSLLQSPINIEKAIVVKDSSLGALSFSYTPSCNSTLTNDGRTLQLTIPKHSSKNSKSSVWSIASIAPLLTSLSCMWSLYSTTFPWYQHLFFHLFHIHFSSRCQTFFIFLTTNFLECYRSTPFLFINMAFIFLSSYLFMFLQSYAVVSCLFLSRLNNSYCYWLYIFYLQLLLSLFYFLFASLLTYYFLNLLHLHPYFCVWITVTHISPPYYTTDLSTIKVSRNCSF